MLGLGLIPFLGFLSSLSTWAIERRSCCLAPLATGAIVLTFLLDVGVFSLFFNIALKEYFVFWQFPFLVHFLTNGECSDFLTNSFVFLLTLGSCILYP